MIYYVVYELLGSIPKVYHVYKNKKIPLSLSKRYIFTVYTERDNDSFPSTTVFYHFYI